MSTKEDELREIMESMPTDTKASFGNSGEGHYINIPWSQKGRGFGEYRFFVGEDKKIQISNECDPREAIKEVMDDLVDNYPEQVKAMFHQMIDQCKLTSEK